MNIDYSKIIETANRRKDVLINLEAQLEGAGNMVSMLREIISWTGHLNETYRTLDTEGRALLPQEIKVALEYAQSTHMYLSRALSDNQMAGGIQTLDVGAV